MSDSAATDPSLSELDAFDYELPRECIAQEPAKRRDEARLLVMSRSREGDSASQLDHRRVSDLPGLLREGDLVVMNATRVLPARLRGQKPTGGSVEALILGEDRAGSGRFRALVRVSGRLRVGQKFAFSAPAHGEAPDPGTPAAHAGLTLEAELVERAERGEVVLQFDREVSPYSVGSAPLPPYIRRRGETVQSAGATVDGPDEPGEPGEFDETARERREFDLERYQTIFARVPGAVAAPTAGLHFTPELLRALGDAGVRTAEVVLHVGAGTFRPLSAADLAAGRLHAEPYCVPAETAEAIADTRARGGRVVAIGTTTTRVLEACAQGDGRAGVRAGSGETRLFLRPPAPFRVVDALLTNFHLPRSSLLLLVAAFAGREAVLNAYRTAIARGYRFYSYGDAMLIR